MTSDKKPEYPVGYCKPPKDSQFKKGASGNPKGRPRGSTNFSTDLQSELRSTIQITDDEGKKKISKQKALAKRIVNQSITGDARTMDILVKEIHKIQNTVNQVLAITSSTTVGSSLSSALSVSSSDDITKMYREAIKNATPRSS